jgi:3-hydroxyacyl-[acyl-carrier-protein] dehydratase
MSEQHTVSGFDILRIMQMIPHRFPMLLVDRVEDIIPGVSARGIKAVTMNEPFFQGHFPSRPVMPGVLLVEALAQTAAVHTIASMGVASEGKLVYFMSIDEAKFRKPVEPGCLLDLYITVLKSRGNICKFSGQVKNNGVLMAEASFTAMIADNAA